MDAPQAPSPQPPAVNDGMAAHLAAGFVASALIERYLADAIAERGAELVTHDVSARSTAMAEVSDAVLADEDFGEQ